MGSLMLTIPRSAALLALAMLVAIVSGRAWSENLDVLQLLQQTSPVSDEDLSGQRGRKDLNIEEIVLQMNEVTAQASIENNSLNSTGTGANKVETGAFNGAAGIVFAVQNTGNHVVIQNTTLINVNMNP